MNPYLIAYIVLTFSWVGYILHFAARNGYFEGHSTGANIRRGALAVLFNALTFPVALGIHIYRLVRGEPVAITWLDLEG